MAPAAESTLERLGGVAGGARPAGPGDAIGGVGGGDRSVVVSPSSTAEVAAVVGECHHQGLAVVARGAGTKLRWGAPPRRLDVVIDTTRLAGVVEHVAGDLVATVRAGTPLDDLATVLAGAGQRLSLDPVVDPGPDGHGTVGGLIATAATGPLRLSGGAVRDLLIGATIVRADGAVARVGGKVVKNVAGYDLCKLLAGSWGTLAIVTEATFRLHPLPAACAWVGVAIDPGGVAAACAATASAVSSQAVPAAVELDLSPAGGALIVLVEGGDSGVAARAAAIAAVTGGEVAARPAWWGRAPWPSGGTAVRLTFALSGLAAVLDAVAGTGPGWALRGSVGVGVVHVGWATSESPTHVVGAVAALRAAAPAWGGDVVVLDAPDEVRARVDLWGPARGLELMRKIKQTFDPGQVLAPGRFVGGI